MIRIHITGASGSGTTTLGRSVAASIDVPHYDTDDFYWQPTEPPFTTKLAPEACIALLQEKLASHPGWVLSGSALKWGQPLEPLFHLVVFLALDPTLRMNRLRQRERTRHGLRIEPGGDMAERSTEFLAWAEAYDSAGEEQRSRAAHEKWLSEQNCSVLRLDSAEPVQALTEAVLTRIRSGR